MKNELCLEGRLAGDLRVRTAKNGAKFISFSLAHTIGEREESAAATNFFNCIAWDHVAEAVSKIYRNTIVEVKGSLRVHEWEDKEKQKHKNVEIRVSSIKVVGKENPEPKPAARSGEEKKTIQAKAVAPAITNEDGSEVKLPWDEDDD